MNAAHQPMARRVMLAKVRHFIPLELESLYKGRCAGRLSWLTRENPEGRRDRSLWVLVDEYDRWAIPRGLPLLSAKLTVHGGVRAGGTA